MMSHTLCPVLVYQHVKDQECPSIRDEMTLADKKGGGPAGCVSRWIVRRGKHGGGETYLETRQWPTTAVSVFSLLCMPQELLLVVVAG